MSEPEHKCPVCATELRYHARYPNYVCDSCIAKATDEHGLPLKFFNTGMYGGFEAVCADTDEVRTSHICFINGRRCYADEARTGGIVVELIAPPVI